jgi:hypothetical protein
MSRGKNEYVTPVLKSVEMISLKGDMCYMPLT